MNQIVPVPLGTVKLTFGLLGDRCRLIRERTLPRQHKKLVESGRIAQLLDVMSKCADHIDAVFGDAPGKRRGYPGHPEIEMALVKLAGATGRQRYLKLARFFVKSRGTAPSYFTNEAKQRGELRSPYQPQYYQDHLPVAEQHEAVGHAVRAMYLYCGMSDVAVHTNDDELLAACQRLWESVTQRKLYITGGIGARWHGEAFGEDFELPSNTAYVETCATIGLIFFAHRMLHIHAHARYADILERSLLTLILKMPVEQIAANPMADSLRGCVALQRGPVLYCAEQVDHDVPVSTVTIARSAALETQWRPDLLGGCQIIRGSVWARPWHDHGSLYAPVGQSGELPRTRLTAIPYALWANRGDHAMTVWLQRSETDSK